MRWWLAKMWVVGVNPICPSLVVGLMWYLAHWHIGGSNSDRQFLVGKRLVMEFWHVNEDLYWLCVYVLGRQNAQLQN